MDRTINKIRESLSGTVSHEFLVFLFFLCVSFGFWLLQALNETFEAEVFVPLRLTGVPDNVLITTELPSQVDVTVRDRGTTLIRYYNRNALNPIEIDFSKYDNGSMSARVQVPLSDVQRAIQNQLNTTSRIQTIRPDTLEFFYNRGSACRLPVRVDGTVSASPRNYVSKIVVEPESVMVYAPSAMLDTMRAAYTRALTLKGLTENFIQTVGLHPYKGVRYEPSTVKVTAELGYYAEKRLEVPIVGLNFPGDKVLRTFPSKATLTFRVESERYQRITADNFVLLVTYEELLKNQSEKFRLHLKSLPQGVSNVRISPQEVDYLIERSNVEEEQER